MINKRRYTKIQEAKDRGTVSVFPEHIFQIDKDKEFGNYAHISTYLDTIIQSKLDLITLLHFSDLQSIKTYLFFALSGIDVNTFSNVPPQEAKQKIKDILLDEQIKDCYGLPKGKTSIMNIHSQRKKEFPINLDKYTFKHHGVYNMVSNKHVPQTEKEQKEFLSQLIDQGFFAIQNSYKNWDHLVIDLIHNMGFFVCGRTGSTYPEEYTKWIIIESYSRGKLSDYCLGGLLLLRFKNSGSYKNNILEYIEEVHQYPELVKKIIRCMEIYFIQEKK